MSYRTRIADGQTERNLNIGEDRVTGALRNVLFAIIVSMALSVGSSFAQETIEIDLSTSEARARSVEELQEESNLQILTAEDFALQQNMPIRGETTDGEFFEIMSVEDGRPVYNITNNAVAAISTAADKVRDALPFSVDGAGVISGVWDGGAILSTHQEFGARVMVKDGAATSSHSTHVGGTIGAAGVVSSAKGMAPATDIDSYDWNSDQAEMASRAATTSVVTPGTDIYHSNHSYGFVTGWIFADYSGNDAWHWFGTWGQLEDKDFGLYGSSAAAWDAISYNAPYYLILKSAGNDRGDGPPGEGDTFYRISGNVWVAETYASASHPPVDGGSLGYDSIPQRGNAKNILTVAAGFDAESGGQRDVSVGTITSFSGFGPTDDGRVKPDVTGNGASLYSTDHVNNTSYTTKSGTSMSTPNVSGSATLLIDYYRDRFGGQNMRSSMLKGLLIHTATEIGNPGPDYTYGWGYVDTEAAANLIKRQADNSSSAVMVEGTLDGGNPSRSYTYTWDGASPLWATLVWTDPAGTSQTGLDVTTAALVNDLDVRITAPDGTTTFLPYVLNPASPASNATTGDNILDNVEQVYIGAPPQSGAYMVTVSHKGALTNSSQVFSLLVSGGTSPNDLVVTPTSTSSAVGSAGGPFTPASATYNISNIGGSSISWTVSADVNWLSVAPASGSLAGGSNLDVAISPNSNAILLPARTDPYQATLNFTDVGTGFTIERSYFLTVNGDSKFSENFDGASHSLVNLATGDDFNWTHKSGPTGSVGTGPTTDHSGTGGYIYTEASTPNNPSKVAIIDTPAISLSGATNGELAFWYHMFGTDVGSLAVAVSTNGGSTWSSSIWSTSGNQGDVWKRAIVDLSAYDGLVINLRFTGITGSTIGGWSSDIAIDDIGVIATPPLAPVVSGVDSVQLNGTVGIGETVDIDVAFSQPVTVTGVPTLELETGTTDRTALYLNGSGSAMLTFRYTVLAGDISPDLDYTSTTALQLNGGTIKNGAISANLTLPAPGATGSLGANESFVIDGVPKITITSPVSATTWEQGSVQTITWTSQGIPGNVRIYYSTTGSTSTSGGWTLIGWGTPYQGWDVANDGSHSWEVESPVSGNVSIMVRSMSETIPGVTNWWDTDGISDAFTVTAPSTSPQIDYDSSNSAKSGAATSLSWSHTIGSGTNRALVVATGVENFGDGPTPMPVTSITYNGVAMTPIPGAVAEEGTTFMNRSELFYLLDADLPSAGSYTVSVTFAGTVYPTGGSISLADVAQQGPEAVASASNAGTNLSTPIFTHTDGAWIVDTVCSGTSGSWTATGTDQNERWEQVNSVWMTTSAGTTLMANSGFRTMDWTGPGVRHTHSVAAFAPLTPHVTVTSPTSSTSWKQGTDQTITWNSLGVPGLVKIYASTDNGSSWTGIDFAAPNTGSYTWTVDAGLAVADPSNTTMKVRVRSKDDSSLSDDSEVFTVAAPDPPPAAGLSVAPTPVQEGSVLTISWPDAEVSHSQVKIYYSLNGGSSWTGINYKAPNTGTYLWTVDTGLTSGDSAHTNVKVRVRSRAGHSDYSEDSAVFTIQPPAAPPGNPIGLTPTPIQFGQTLTITWPSGDVSHSKVKIYYSLDGGSSWTGINYAAPNTGTYDWVVNSATSTQVKIRVRSKAGHTDFSADSEIFSITAGP